MLPQDLNIWGFHGTFLHHFRSPENVSSHDHINLPAKTGKVNRLFKGSIPTTNNRNILFPIKKSVAGCTSRNARACILLFIWDSQILGCCSCGNNNCLCFNYFLFIYCDQVFRTRKIGGCCKAPTDICSKPYGLFFKVFHHFRTSNPIGIARKIFNFGSRGQLSSWLQTLVHNWIKVGTRSINCGSKSSWSGTDDQAFDLFDFPFCLFRFRLVFSNIHWLKEIHLFTINCFFKVNHFMDTNVCKKEKGDYFCNRVQQRDQFGV